jgi:putative SOS response-associated peptidase YedK
MPVIIDKADFKEWLSPESTPERLQSIMDSSHKISFVYHPVDKKMNYPSYEDEDCVERILLKQIEDNNLDLF